MATVPTTDYERTKARNADARHKARYWMLTIPHRFFTPYLPPGVGHITGQLERGESGGESGYLHWQLVVTFAKQIRRSNVCSIFGDECHAEATISKKAEKYCLKDDTAVEGTRFSLGSRSVKRGNCTDWGSIVEAAKSGELDDVPADIYLRYYGNLKRISVEHARPVAMERSCVVYWGPTGTGKSRRAWGEAGLDAYPKDPNTKFWCGYRGQSAVVIDEFRGNIGISHLLRWLDRYPVLVEVKGSSTVFKAEKVWITSNLHPREWYKDVDELTMEALLRRLDVIEIN